MVANLESLLCELHLHTICDSALCPNIGKCFNNKTATFLILGDICTRHCTFCAVQKGRPRPVDENEPSRLLEAVDKLGLSYVVVTSVARDDLPDGGAHQFARVIDLLHLHREGIQVEVLIPDFLGSRKALKSVIDAVPDVINHNIETVSRLYSQVRPQADVDRQR